MSSNRAPANPDKEESLTRGGDGRPNIAAGDLPQYHVTQQGTAPQLYMTQHSTDLRQTQ